MTTYELLKTIDPNRLNELVKAGIIIPEWRRWLKMYECFKEYCEHTGRMEAYVTAGERFYSSSENVRKIVRRMEAVV